ncbi:MAG: biotin transporter BioY [Pseudolabrys sp.]|nr:biotin transporter BioY [Pseudolabrys sp.]MDP2298917.1 biotin transporter BioY [Pseudolabrys sp.]
MNATLVSTVSPHFSSSALGKFTIIVGGTILLTISAKVQVPFWPVPMTMQTFVVLVMAMACGPVIGGNVMAVYLVEGALGFPVFSGTPERASGLVYLMGPTGGYLAGMLFASLVCGWLSICGWGRSALTTLLAMLIGTFIIFLSGYLWLAMSIGPMKAWTFGVVPFLLSESLKIGLAALLLPVSWSLVGQVKNRRS